MDQIVYPVSNATEAIFYARKIAWLSGFTGEKVIQLTVDLVNNQDDPDKFYSLFSTYFGDKVIVAR